MQNVKEEPVDVGEHTHAEINPHVPSKKLISERITSVPVELSSGIHSNEGEGGIEEAQTFIDQHEVCLKNQSGQHRSKPQPQTRFTGESIFNRLGGKRGHPSSGKFRKVCKDILCLPAEYLEDNCTYRVPRGKEREQLAMLGLVGKVFIQSSWNFENFRTEVITLFQKYFSCSEEEFSFTFLQCLPGNRKLIKPNVSATFKWSGIAIMSLAAQGSLYLQTPHTLAAPAKNLFFNIKQELPIAETENINNQIPSDRTIPEINHLGDTGLSVCQISEEDPQLYTKDLKVFQHQELRYVRFEPTSNISTRDNAKKLHMEEKSFNMTNDLVFKLLRDAGIKTAQVRKVSENRFVTCGCEIIPFAWGCWRIATGMYLKRHPGTEGRRLYPPRVEIFYK
ncbi:Phosphoribosylaminoimidazole carboxylase, partial [Pristimantis euphronides]